MPQTLVVQGFTARSVACDESLRRMAMSSMARILERVHASDSFPAWFAKAINSLNR
ncbi:protein of unknown function [Ralstonia solanacearum CMR15]|nr:protein of unknown function [Ralstonia solanacearum CMR15]